MTQNLLKTLTLTLFFFTILAVPAFAHASIEVCDDNIDNDSNGDIDCADIYCSAAPACTVAAAPPGATASGVVVTCPAGSICQPAPKAIKAPKEPALNVAIVAPMACSPARVALLAAKVVLYPQWNVVNGTECKLDPVYPGGTVHDRPGSAKGDDVRWSGSQLRFDGEYEWLDRLAQQRQARVHTSDIEGLRTELLLGEDNREIQLRIDMEAADQAVLAVAEAAQADAIAALNAADGNTIILGGHERRLKALEARPTIDFGVYAGVFGAGGTAQSDEGTVDGETVDIYTRREGVVSGSVGARVGFNVPATNVSLTLDSSVLIGYDAGMGVGNLTTFGPTWSLANNFRAGFGIGYLGLSAGMVNGQASAESHEGAALLRLQFPVGNGSGMNVGVDIGASGGVVQWGMSESKGSGHVFGRLTIGAGTTH